MALVAGLAAVSTALAPSTTLGAVGSPHATGSVQLCPPATPTSHPHAVSRLRIGVDPGIAGNPLPSTEATKPVNHKAQLRALEDLRPRHRVLVVRLNRLFWSGGAKSLASFKKRASYYARHGFEVEAQVRYQPNQAENGDIPRWTRWIRHVTNVLGQNKKLVAMTITNEVNFTISPNTSDGSFKRAKDALIRGIEAASAQLHKRGWANRVSVGFTFAYRLNPAADAGLFTYLASHGGARFRKALGFVGLDDYPGIVYPPALIPGSSAGDELAGAIATMRTCYLPLGRIPPSTPIWITENGFPSSSPLHSDAQQAGELSSMVTAVRRYGGTYNVTDYRWFNLRDNASQGTGLFDQVGLLRDDYRRKPAYSALRSFIAAHGRRSS
jgi:hypothetical protein